MRTIGSYSAAEWLAFTPLVHRFKYARNQAVAGAFLALGAGRRERFLTENPGLGRGKIAVTVAFNMPWVIDLFLRAARLNLTDTSIIVADNSSRADARAEIEALCRARGVAYIALPKNPEWSPNRSHGIALNWAYHHLIRRLDPPVFAFLDHDLFALERVDLAAPVRGQPVYGHKFVSPVEPEPWLLWAGFCVFDQISLRSRKLDFNYESPLMLDTGGYNWSRLYRDLDVSRLRFATKTEVSFRDPEGGLVHDAVMVDGFVHVLGASHTEAGKASDRVAFFRRLIGYVEDGGGWRDLVLRQEA